jgi:hypothetical protein
MPDVEDVAKEHKVLDLLRITLIEEIQKVLFVRSTISQLHIGKDKDHRLKKGLH